MNLGDRQSSMLLYSDPKDQYSHRVRMMLAEKGVIVDLVDVDAENPPAELANHNPYNTVPTLTDRDLVLYDANIIMEYLDERFPHPPLLQVYPVQRALSRLWIHRIEREWSSKLDPLIAGRGSEASRQVVKSDLRGSLSGTAPILQPETLFHERGVHIGGLLRGAHPLASQGGGHRAARPPIPAIEKLHAKDVRARLVPQKPQ